MFVILLHSDTCDAYLALVVVVVVAVVVVVVVVVVDQLINSQVRYT